MKSLLSASLFPLLWQGLTFLFMFGLLGHNKLSAGCTLRYHVTIMFIPITSPSYCCMHKNTAHVLPAPGAFPVQQRRRHICKRTITRQIKVICGCSCVGLLLYTVSVIIFLCHDYCSVWRWCLQAACVTHINTSEQHLLQRQCSIRRVLEPPIGW